MRARPVGASFESDVVLDGRERSASLCSSAIEQFQAAQVELAGKTSYGYAACCAGMDHVAQKSEAASSRRDAILSGLTGGTADMVLLAALS